MKTNRTFLEKLAVAAMFVLVLVVFSFANRDTQKILQLHSRSLGRVAPPPPPAPLVLAEQPGSSTSGNH